MSKYFEVLNNNNYICIDDEYKYFSELGSINLSNSSLTPINIPSFNAGTNYTFYSKNLNINQVEQWMYCEDSFFMSRSTCPRYMAYIKQVAKENLYGIRFKKASVSPKIYVRLSNTFIGSSITKTNENAYIMIEVASTDKTTPINNVNAYLEYFEVIEIGNSLNFSPNETNIGLECFNDNGELVYSSSNKTANIVYGYNGSNAGVLDLNWFTTNHIIIPNKNYNRADGYTRSNRFNLRFDLYKDFYTYDGVSLKNSILLFGGNDGYSNNKSRRCALWDCRDMGCDLNQNISGLILL